MAFYGVVVTTLDITGVDALPIWPLWAWIVLSSRSRSAGGRESVAASDANPDVALPPGRSRPRAAIVAPCGGFAGEFAAAPWTKRGSARSAGSFVDANLSAFVEG